MQRRKEGQTLGISPSAHFAPWRVKNESIGDTIMFRSILLPILLTIAPLLRSGSARAEQPTPSKTKTVRLLTVGNSFSQNATQYLGDLVKAKGHTLIHRPLAIGGASLEVHWEKAQLHEKDRKDP